MGRTNRYDLDLDADDDLDDELIDDEGDLMEDQWLDGSFEE